MRYLDSDHILASLFLPHPWSRLHPPHELEHRRGGGRLRIYSRDLFLDERQGLAPRHRGVRSVRYAFLVDKVHSSVYIVFAKEEFRHCQVDSRAELGGSRRKVFGDSLSRDWDRGW